MGYINEKCEPITDFVYDTCVIEKHGERMYSALDGYIIVRQGDLWGLIDTEGNSVIDVKYTGISQIGADRILWAEQI